MESNPGESTLTVEAAQRGAEAACNALQQGLETLGLDAGPHGVAIGGPAELNFRTETDSVTGAVGWVGEWRNPRGGRIGQFILRADGGLYAEYDILRPHPSRAGWFVEALEAWGRVERITTEPRLLPIPSEADP